MSEDIFDERRTADGRRRINLTRQERAGLVERELVEGAVALYLDIHNHRTNEQIAEQLGITVKQLKRLTNTEHFIATYNEHFIELGHDPRLKAIRSSIMDLLPRAYKELDTLLTAAGTPAGTKAKLILKIFELCGIKPTDPQVSDKRELAEFLKEASVNINEVHIHNVPQEYQSAVSQAEEGYVDEYDLLEGREIIDVEAIEIEDEE